MDQKDRTHLLQVGLFFHQQEPMKRRDFIRGGAATAALTAVFCRAEAAHTRPLFKTSNTLWQSTYDRALQILAANVQVLPRFDGPVLIEGAEYPGVWMECAPQEGLVYARWRPDVARNNHMTFFLLQREDGQLPANNKRSESGFGQIQMVVPIAATAWELAERTGDDELLRATYHACSRWDAWLRKYRDTRATGLVEGFCTYDTGQDNSPRWRGVSNQCPGKDAKRWVPGQGTPRLCPDLSATVFGGRIALARMAHALGKSNEAAMWQESAEALRTRILKRLFDEQDLAFYDLDAGDQFVKVRGDVLSRVCGEHVVSQPLFERLWAGQLHKPSAFWPRYPLPSIALDDPSFVRPIPRNSWGGASQALTALRAPRWMEFYGKPAQLAEMLSAWCEALQRDQVFRQQMDPETGVFTEGGSKGYSPAALVMVDSTWRLAGVREEPDQLEWNVRPTCAAADGSLFQTHLKSGVLAEMRYTNGGADLFLGGKPLARVQGTARLLTKPDGHALQLVGIADPAQAVELTWAHGRRERFNIPVNKKLAVRG